MNMKIKNFVLHRFRFCFAQVPPDVKYVDYMVIATGKSERHITALSELVRKIYKKKKNFNDKVAILEGKNTGWNALDMG